MRIADPNSPGNTLPAQTGAPAPQTRMDAGSGAITAGAITAGSDRTDLSGVADRLSGILQGEASSRADRISQLKADVASGAYRVDANAVSRAMVKETLSASGDSTSK